MPALLFVTSVVWRGKRARRFVPPAQAPSRKMSSAFVRFMLWLGPLSAIFSEQEPVCEQRRTPNKDFWSAKACLRGFLEMGPHACDDFSALEITASRPGGMYSDFISSVVPTHWRLSFCETKPHSYEIRYCDNQKRPAATHPAVGSRRSPHGGTYGGSGDNRRRSARRVRW
jgi:hypothetical protein